MNNPYRTLGGGLGWAGALVYAFKVKSGFWKGFGYVILGSIAGMGIGAGIDAIAGTGGPTKKELWTVSENSTDNGDGTATMSETKIALIGYVLSDGTYQDPNGNVVPQSYFDNVTSPTEIY